ncbi:TonB-dependent receptor [Sphingomonas oligophenolica]|uniref:TonB-dependent receptor n=1 Tax=Sphingomonas oligophenolica TaxID=301154 RepID=A0ABU9Y982_9SPHN
MARKVSQARSAMLCSACLMMAPMGAWAQDANAAPGTTPAAQEPAPAEIGEIVVTALRRDQRLQEAPAAISVVTAETIRSSGVVGLSDISKVVPSLRFEGGIRPGVPSIALRGISAVQGGDAPVSILVDGVQVPFLSLARMDLLDISSVEILKGPQGALYGRGAIAGAIVINTRQPDDHLRFTGRVIAQEGSDYQGIATISGPIVSDLIYAKLTGSYQNRRGLLKNGFLNTYDDFVDQGTIDGEVVLKPAAGTRIQLTGMYTRGRVGTNALALVPTARLNDFSVEIDSNFRNYDRRRLWRAAIKLDQETPLGTLTVVAQHARARDYVVTDLDYTRVATRYNYNPELDEATNVDGRLSSTKGGAFNWIVGAFWQYRTGENFINALQDPAALTPQSTILSYQAGNSRSWGAYGQGSLDLQGGVSVIGALRYDRDKRFDQLTNVAGSAISGSFDAWQPSATLKWQAQRDLMFYATYGQGFRSGGFNAANLVVPAVGARRIYDKEVSRNYEVGFKSQFADRRVTLNASAFHTDYDNTQYQRTILTPVSARYVTSIPKSHVNGAEAELTFRPVDAFTMRAAASITKTRIDDFDGTTLYVGNRLPNAYTDNQQVSIDYTPRFDATYRGLFHLDLSRRGSISYDLANAVSYGPAAFLNARIGVQTDRWSIAVFGANLTDRRAPEFVFPNFFGANHGRLANLPFRAGIEFNVNIGN